MYFPLLCSWFDPIFLGCWCCLDVWGTDPPQQNWAFPGSAGEFAPQTWTLNLMLLNINLFNWGGGCLTGGRLTRGTALDKEVIIFIPWLHCVECRWGLSGCNYLRSVQRVTPILQQQEQGWPSLNLLLWLSLGFQAASTLPLFSAWPAYFIRITPNHCVLNGVQRCFYFPWYAIICSVRMPHNGQGWMTC